MACRHKPRYNQLQFFKFVQQRCPPSCAGAAPAAAAARAGEPACREPGRRALLRLQRAHHSAPRLMQGRCGMEAATAVAKLLCSGRAWMESMEAPLLLLPRHAIQSKRGAGPMRNASIPCRLKRQHAHHHQNGPCTGFHPCRRHRCCRPRRPSCRAVAGRGWWGGMGTRVSKVQGRQPTRPDGSCSHAHARTRCSAHQHKARRCARQSQERGAALTFRRGGPAAVCPSASPR